MMEIMTECDGLLAQRKGSYRGKIGPLALGEQQMQIRRIGTLRL